SYFRGESEVAIRELEHAVKLSPQSIAARALLAASFVDYGQWERSGQLIRELDQLAPASPEDYLFKGLARESHSPGLGIRDLDEGIRRRDSPLGRALRGTARANRALDTAQVHDAEAALADANAAWGMLPDNPLVVSARIYAHVIASGIYQEA